MPDKNDFFLLQKKLSRKKFLFLFGAGSVSLLSFLKNPFGLFKKHITESKQGSSIKFKENPFSVKRNKS